MLEGPACFIAILERDDRDRHPYSRVHPRDSDAVRSLWVAAWLKPSRSDTYEAMAKVATRNPGLALVAEGENVLIVGTVNGTDDGRQGWVCRLPAHPEARKAGLGRRLVEELEGRLRAQGCEKLNLLVERDNPDAIAF
ncbi:MAG: GNAT family N-acetyltransferase [Rhodospirillaceae bacterium]|nr:GNAT family N-acetyltransferase [Rhodospirillaceae bacterium]